MSTENNTEKPYDRCLTCPQLGKRCDGPNFLAMSTQRLSQWCRSRKDHLHMLDSKWINQYIADQAGVSKQTVDQFLSGYREDLRLSTVVPIVKVLVNGTWGQYPCADNPDTREMAEKLSVATEKCENLQQTVAFYESQIQEKDKHLNAHQVYMSERADFLRQKDRSIRILAVIACILILVIVGFLIADIANPDKGFFWLERIAGLVS